MKKIRSVLLILLACAMILPVCACGKEEIVPEGELSAEVVGSDSNESFEYNIYSDGTVGITKYTGGYTRHTVPSEIDGMQVSRIEERAYFDCGLVKVTIPDSVIYIGDSAFAYNDKLVKADMSDNCLHIGTSAFYNCKGLKKIDIPDCLEYIGAFAFTLTEWIESHKEDYVVVGDGILIKYLGTEAHVTIPDEVRFISSAFGALNGRDPDTKRRLESVTVGDNVEIIGDSAFAYCCYMTSISISDSVQYIGSSAFRDCILLTEIDLPDSITRIEDYTFYACSGFLEYTIPDHIEYIGEMAFATSLGLEKITVGSNVSYLDITAFEGCDYLEEIVVSQDNEYYSAEELCLYDREKTEIYLYHKNKNDTEFALPDSVVTVGIKAFAGNESLAELYLSDSIESIGVSAFNGCSSLEYIHIPGTLKSIANGALSDCVALTEIFYAGSREQWNSVELGERNTSLDGAFINYDYVEEK